MSLKGSSKQYTLRLLGCVITYNPFWRYKHVTNFSNYPWFASSSIRLFKDTNQRYILHLPHLSVTSRTSFNIQRGGFSPDWKHKRWDHGSPRFRQDGPIEVSGCYKVFLQIYGLFHPDKTAGKHVLESKKLSRACKAVTGHIEKLVERNGFTSSYKNGIVMTLEVLFHYNCTAEEEEKTREIKKMVKYLKKNVLHARNFWRTWQRSADRQHGTKWKPLFRKMRKKGRKTTYFSLEEKWFIWQIIEYKEVTTLSRFRHDKNNTSDENQQKGDQTNSPLLRPSFEEERIPSNQKMELIMGTNNT